VGILSGDTKTPNVGVTAIVSVKTNRPHADWLETFATLATLRKRSVCGTGLLSFVAVRAAIADFAAMTSPVVT
jgi:hypothetical protein